MAGGSRKEAPFHLCLPSSTTCWLDRKHVGSHKASLSPRKPLALLQMPTGCWGAADPSHAQLAFLSPGGVLFLAEQTNFARGAPPNGLSGAPAEPTAKV